MTDESLPPAPSTRESLPYWIEQRAGYSGAVFAHGVYLGFVRSEWPVRCWAADADGGCSAGALWAAESPTDRLLVGPVPIPDDVPVLSARPVPAAVRLERRTP